MTSSKNSVDEELLDFVKRVEKLHIERSVINETIRDVLWQAEVNGYRRDVINEMVKLRKKDPEDVLEYELMRAKCMERIGIGG